MLTLADLDRIETYKDVDRNDMLSKIIRLPEDFLEAYDMALKVEVPKSIQVGSKRIKYETPDKVVICGMGGSAIGGDILRAWLRDRIKIPLEVVRSYHLPAYVDEKTLVMAVSYSGETEETISCFVEALKRGSMVIAVTSGGLLGYMASEAGIPLFKAPSGRPPRTALAYLFTPLAIALSKLGIEVDLEDELNEAVKNMIRLREEISPKVPLELNIAKKLALEISGLIPVIYASTEYYPIAFRFKTQLNENSKYPAKCDELPELNHNDIVGWDAPMELTKKFLVIMLMGGDEPMPIKRRIEVTKDIVRRKAHRVVVLEGRGLSRLSRMLSLLYVGDFTSYYLALLRGVDPSPTPAIDLLKSELDKRMALKRELREEFKKLLGE